MNLQGDDRVCFVGDSFVQGTWDPECRGWVGRVAAAARSRGYNITAYNLGVRKDTSRDIRDRWEAECQARFRWEGTARVVFSFGANDMTEESGRLRAPMDESVANFQAILSAAKARYPVLTLGPLPVGDDDQDRRILALCARYQSAAKDLDVPYLPLASFFVHHPGWRAETSANDGSHPGSAGYGLLADKVLEWEEWWFGGRG
jgi:lysophospholipase L1-like esterase